MRSLLKIVVFINKPEPQELILLSFLFLHNHYTKSVSNNIDFLINITMKPCTSTYEYNFFAI